MKLSAKISALVLFQAIVFVAIFASVNQFILQKYLNDNQNEWVNTLTLAIAEGISLDVINSKPLNARKQLKNIIELDEAFEYAYVTDFNGDLFVHTFNQGFPRYLLEQINKVQNYDTYVGIKFSTKDGNIYETALPLIKGLRARLHVGINQNEITNLIWKTRIDIFWISILIILLGMVIAILMGRRISAPMAQLSTWMNRYGEGQAQEELNLKNTDSEVDDLVNSFKSMIEGRSKLEQALQKSNEELEEKVKLRTEDYLLAKEDAENANNAKSQFLSSMSHELRTPLHAVLGFSQIIELNSNDEQTKSNAKEIINGGNHLLTLINEILDLSKIESGNTELSIENHSFNTILNSVLIMIQPFADEHFIKINNKASPSTEIYINVDGTRFKQVLLNILSNAIKYNSEKGEVIIEYSPNSENILCLSISDTGVGLTSEQLSKLFIPFERFGVENSHIEGTGLGLVIAKDLIELMGGTIAVESTVGKGSCFLIQIPIS